MKVAPFDRDADVRKQLDLAEAYRVTFGEGRHGWPEIFVYAIEVDGEVIESPLPPRLSDDRDIDRSAEFERENRDPHSRKASSQPKTWPYRIVVRPGAKWQILYWALVAHGRPRDLGHTGGSAGPIEDARAAPAA